MSIESRIDSLDPQIVTFAGWSPRWPDGFPGSVVGANTAYAVNGVVEPFNTSFNGLRVVDNGIRSSLEGTRSLDHRNLRAANIGHQVIAGPFESFVGVPFTTMRDIQKRTLFGTKTISTPYQSERFQAYRPSIGELTGEDDSTPASIIGVRLVPGYGYVDNGRRTRDLMAGIVTDEENVSLFRESLLENPLLARRFTAHILRNIIGIEPELIPDPNYTAIDAAAPFTQFVEKATDKPTEGIVLPTDPTN